MLPVAGSGEWRHICHFFGDQKCDASHFWQECDALAHENIFLTCDVFCHNLPEKRHILEPPVQTLFQEM